MLCIKNVRSENVTQDFFLLEFHLSTLQHLFKKIIFALDT